MNTYDFLLSNIVELWVCFVKKANSLEIAGFEAAQVGQMAAGRKKVALQSQGLLPVLDPLPGKPREANVAALGTGLHHMGQAFFQMKKA